MSDDALKLSPADEERRKVLAGVTAAAGGLALARSIRPEVFVTISLCAHLGCIPSFLPEPGSQEPGWPGGWYCPCHGSKFDLAGRVWKGSPAPTNLVIPPYRYESDTRIVIGIDT